MMHGKPEDHRPAQQEQATQREGVTAPGGSLDDAVARVQQERASRQQICAEYQPLMMGLMDQELTAAEATAVNDHLTRCHTCRQEYESLRQTSGKLAAISFMEPTDEVLVQFWKHPYNALERKAGIYLVLSGLTALLLYGGYLLTTTFDWQLLLSGGEEVIPGLALASLLVGLLLVLISLLRERLRVAKTDPYKDIKR
jgi:hypothetical protein